MIHMGCADENEAKNVLSRVKLIRAMYRAADPRCSAGGEGLGQPALYEQWKKVHVL